MRPSSAGRSVTSPLERPLAFFKKVVKRAAFLLGICLYYCPIFAQQLPTFLNYANNWNVLNPAAVSPDFMVDDYYRLSVQATYRQQWAGLEDAPETQTLSATFMSESHPILVGGQLLNDKTGAIGLTGAYGQFAYRLQLDRKHFLSGGLNLGLVQYRVNVTEIQLLEAGDILANQDGARLFPDFGLGLFYQYDDLLYAGFSIPQTFGLTNTFQAQNRDYQLTRTRHYYAMTGANIYLNSDKTSYFAISSWLKYLSNAPLTVDFNAKYFFQDVFWLGLGGGTTDFAHLEAGVIIGNGIGYMDNRLTVGIGYDFALSAATQLLGNTVEVIVRYSIGGG
ncbi:MAG: type IX secretion system membrane protein PorP/SprF [Bacteroidota bacterium]